MKRWNWLALAVAVFAFGATARLFFASGSASADVPQGNPKIEMLLADGYEVKAAAFSQGITIWLQKGSTLYQCDGSQKESGRVPLGGVGAVERMRPAGRRAALRG